MGSSDDGHPSREWSRCARHEGIPVSATHTITVAIVGAARRVSAGRWNVASGIVVAWVVTLPAAALVSAAFYVLAGLFG
jgi:PiT family inorganic phosphate transporter